MTLTRMYNLSKPNLCLADAKYLMEEYNEDGIATKFVKNRDSFISCVNLKLY